MLVAAINTADRDEIIQWMQEFCDPNGCHTDELARAEGFEPYTLETAREAAVNLVHEREDHGTHHQ